MKAINKKLLDLAEDGNSKEIKRIENFKHIDWTSLRKDNTSLLSMFIELDNDALYYIKKCLDAGANINQANNQGTTALHIAALSNKPEIVDFLILNNAKFDIQTDSSLIALKQILHEKYELIIYKLLEIVDDYPRLKDNLKHYKKDQLDYLDEIKKKVEFVQKIKDDLPEKIEKQKKNKI
jgi:ankyrin repeat protein